MALLNRIPFLARFGSGLRDLASTQQRLLEAIGRQESRALDGRALARIRDAEFRIFSQWGEDGIIQYLVRHVPIENHTFVEFGVQDYSESNTRFLLVNDNWSGLILDASDAHQRFVAAKELDWRYSLTATVAFVDRDNINRLIGDAGLRGDIGLLSIDIDGNDYWILEAIEVVSPRILIVEYNSSFGPSHAVTVPYDPSFQREKAHFSNLYYGASLAALVALAARKGFAFVGSNSAGNNAFFVRRDVLRAPLKAVEPADEYVSSRFRESRGHRGQLTYLGNRTERLRLLRDLEVVHVPGEVRAPISQVFGV